MDNKSEKIKAIQGLKVAYDRCHKIYICEDAEDIETAKSYGYYLYEINELEGIYNISCCLRFISNWKLTKEYISQGE